MLRTCLALALLMLVHAPVAAQEPELPLRKGLVLWLDAQTLTAGNGQPVAEWQDKSGNGRHARQHEASRQPVCRTDLLPGKQTPRVVFFDGQRSGLLIDNVNAQLEFYTIFLVAAPSSNHGGFRALLAGNQKGQSDFLSGFTLDLGHEPRSRWDRLNAEGKGYQGMRDVLVSGGHDFGTFHVCTVASRPGKLGAQLFLDGQTKGYRPRNPSRITLDELRLGVRHYHPGGGTPITQGHFEGGIAEVLIYDTVLDTAEREQVEAYLRRKYEMLFQVTGLPAERVVHMLVPGFTVQELPVDLTSINAMAYDPKGVLYVAGYDGRLHRLRDTNGDGLEDQAETVWDQPTLRTPTAMRWRPDGLYVVSNGKISRFPLDPKTGKALREEIVVTGWEKDDGHTGGGVDALGLTFDKEGNLFFGLGCADYTNAYRIKDGKGKARYSLKSERGTILKVSKDRLRINSPLLQGGEPSSSPPLQGGAGGVNAPPLTPPSQGGELQRPWDIVCTGIRFPYALVFNRYGDLFCTDQEGETWLPGGNPLDELNHILPGKHYGFPPRHPQHLPHVEDEPPAAVFGPQHQSTCGMVFNEPTFPGWKTFGPDWWENQALVAGYSRGKLWRVPLVKGTDGKYRGAPVLFCCLKLLTLDIVLAPNGDLVVSCHSGPPDWGIGPKAKGRLFRISHAQRSMPLPMTVAVPGPLEVKVTFDQDVPSTWLDVSRATITFGEHVRAGDRFEVHKPPYKVVQEQEQAFRGRLRVIAGKTEGNEITLTTDPHAVQAHYALTIPFKDGSGAIDLEYRIDKAPWHPVPLPKPVLASGPPPELRGGDWERGRKLFFSKEANCSACHTVRGEGGTIGPDLSNLIHRDAGSVLRDITEPNAATNPDYISYSVLLWNGKLLNGIVKTEGTDRIRVFDSQAKETLLRRDEVERMEANSVSAMPVDYAKQFKPDQLKDLLVFLTQEKPSRGSPPSQGAAGGVLRARADVAKLLAAARPVADEARPLNIILVAGPKDHGPGEHDYPAWQRNWNLLLGKVKNVNVAMAHLWPTREQWAKADVVIFYYWNHRWTKEHYQNLDDHLARGGGIITLHSAVIEDHDPESLALRIGLAFSPRLKYRHGPLTLDLRTDKRHPITLGMTKIEFVDESYWNHVGEVQRVDVLASSREEGRPRPMLWTHERGKGRVVGCILGHYAWTFDDPYFRLLLVRSIAWTAQVPEQRFHGVVTDGVSFKENQNR